MTNQKVVKLISKSELNKLAKAHTENILSEGQLKDKWMRNSTILDLRWALEQQKIFIFQNNGITISK